MWSHSEWKFGNCAQGDLGMRLLCWPGSEPIILTHLKPLCYIFWIGYSDSCLLANVLKQYPW